MLAPFEQLLCECKCIVMNISNYLPINLVVTTNYELLCDVETTMVLVCTLPMLEVVQSLSKLAQNKKCFICDFVTKMKLTQVNIYNFYMDPKQHFSHE